MPKPQPSERHADCVFCGLAAANYVAANDLALAVRDIAPATPLHTMVLPRRHAASWFDLDAAERRAVEALVEVVRRDIVSRDPAVAGFNIAVNIGAAAGQTIMHCHLHLVPRRPGDGAEIVLSGPHKRLLRTAPSRGAGRAAAPTAHRRHER